MFTANTGLQGAPHPPARDQRGRPIAYWSHVPSVWRCCLTSGGRAAPALARGRGARLPGGPRLCVTTCPEFPPVIVRPVASWLPPPPGTPATVSQPCPSVRPPCTARPPAPATALPPMCLFTFLFFPKHASLRVTKCCFAPVSRTRLRAASSRIAVLGNGKSGQKAPLLRCSPTFP